MRSLLKGICFQNNRKTMPLPWASVGLPAPGFPPTSGATFLSPFSNISPGLHNPLLPSLYLFSLYCFIPNVLCLTFLTCVKNILVCPGQVQFTPSIIYLSVIIKSTCHSLPSVFRNEQRMLYMYCINRITFLKSKKF